MLPQGFLNSKQFVNTEAPVELCLGRIGGSREALWSVIKSEVTFASPYSLKWPLTYAPGCYANKLIDSLS